MLDAYIPKEIAIGEVYLPPLLIAVLLAYGLGNASLTIVNRLGFSKYIYFPALAELSLIVIYTTLLSMFVLPG